MSLFSKNLNILFEDQLGDNPLDVVSKLNTKLDAARKEVSNLENQLKIATQRLNGDLALGIRRDNPALNVAVNDDGCKVGYKDTFLVLNPDVENGVWSTDSSCKSFEQACDYDGHSLSSDLSGLIRSVIDHFVNYYDLLGEDLVGNGIILVEGKKTTLLELANWRNAIKGPILNSRAARRLVTA